MHLSCVEEAAQNVLCVSKFAFLSLRFRVCVSESVNDKYPAPHATWGMPRNVVSCIHIQYTAAHTTQCNTMQHTKRGIVVLHIYVLAQSSSDIKETSHRLHKPRALPFANLPIEMMSVTECVLQCAAVCCSVLQSAFCKLYKSITENGVVRHNRLSLNL